MLNKKEMIKQYKQTLRPMGIYQITNKANGKIFIGASLDLPGKINSNRFQLQHGSHMNKELQADFRQFGEDAFSFEQVDTLEPKSDPQYDYHDDLAILEEMWLEKLQPYGEKGYNRKKQK